MAVSRKDFWFSGDGSLAGSGSGSGWGSEAGRGRLQIATPGVVHSPLRQRWTVYGTSRRVTHPPPCRSRELIDNKQKQLQPCKRQSSGAAERKTGSTFPSGLRNSSELQRGDICNAPTEFSSMKTLGTHLSSNYPATGR